MEYETGGNPLLPKIIIEDNYFKSLCEPWVKALVIKLLGKHVSYPIMLAKLKLIWKLQHGFDLWDLGHGYLMVKFNSLEDRWKVMSGGPWKVFYHYLIVVGSSGLRIIKNGGLN